MAYSTYSFQDVSVVFSHPDVGQSVLSGDGIGSIGINMANDVSAHDVAADGHVMVSKIDASNGTIALAVQQTSEANDFLMRWYNFIKQAPSDKWAAASFIMRNAVSGAVTECTGVSPQKKADRSYQAQGQQVTWNLMAAEIIDN